MEQCYFCGNLATSREHAPPRQMFKGFDCDSIKVPSCEKHNTKKSGKDQAIVHGFFKSLISYKESLEGDVLKAYNIAASAFDYTKRTAVISNMLKNPTEGFRRLPRLAFLPSNVKMPDWIRQLTAAIFFSATKTYESSIVWEKIEVESPNWIFALGPENIDENVAVSYFEEMEKKIKLMSMLSWELGWSASPRLYPKSIYEFRLHLSAKKIILTHLFYERYIWYAWIPGDKQIVSQLEAKILDYSA